MREILVPERRRQGQPPSQEVLGEGGSGQGVDRAAQLAPGGIVWRGLARQQLAHAIHALAPPGPPARHPPVRERAVHRLAAIEDRLRNGHRRAKARKPCSNSGQVVQSPGQVVVHNASDAAHEQEEVDAALFLLPPRLAVAEALELLPQPVEQVSERKNRVEAPRVRAVEVCFGAYGARCGAADVLVDCHRAALWRNDGRGANRCKKQARTRSHASGASVVAP